MDIFVHSALLLRPSLSPSFLGILFSSVRRIFHLVHIFFHIPSQLIDDVDQPVPTSITTVHKIREEFFVV